MYYDARPCMWNGLFDSFYSPMKPYYSFLMFKELRKLGTQLKISVKNKNIYACASTKGSTSGIILTHYYENGIDNLEHPTEEVKVTLTDLPNEGVKLEYYINDENSDMKMIREES